MNDFNTTKVTIEVEVAHQFNTAQGVQIILDALNFPAIKTIKVLTAETKENTAQSLNCTK